MRLLLDECLSSRLGALLQEAGHDVTHVRDLGLAGASDVEVMACAKDDERVLVSADTDFGELLASSGDSVPSLVLIRRPARDPDAQAHVLVSNLPALGEELASGAVAVILNDRIRIRRLPLGRA